LPGFVEADTDIQRFPPPEFTEHELPIATVPKPRADFYEYLDVALLLLALSLASYLTLKKRSRRGVFILGILSLFYFGFWRKGCVCAIGATQNIALSLFDPGYTVPIAVVAFFTLPLVFTLFFGRTFCSSVCPLGAIQDVVLLRPLRVPSWLEHTLRGLPYLYLGSAVLFAATGSAFIICQYDPFVAIFRRSGSLSMLILGACFLLIGLFVGRPYCRYLCPYSVLLGWMSRASKWHATITPDECIQCRLCEDACPFGAIQKPTPEQMPRGRTEGKKRLAVLMALLPVFIVLGIFVGTRIGAPLSRVDSTVSLAHRIMLEDAGEIEESEEGEESTLASDASDAFRETGRPSYQLYQEALSIDKKFRIGGGILGAFLGLVLGMKMIQLSVRRSREDYQMNRTTCLSCARCFSSCPVENVRLKEQKSSNPGRQDACAPRDTKSWK
jgi:ferredoxin